MVSIQLKLSGHRFSIEELGEATVPAVVTVIGCRSTLVPDRALESIGERRLMALAGMPPSDGEKVVCGSRDNGITCLMAIPSDAIEALTSKYGEGIAYTSPLLSSAHGEEDCTSIETYGKTVYIHCFNDGLKRAESIDAENDADFIGFVATEIESSGLTPAFPIYYRGDKSRLRLLRKHYRNVRCE